MTRGDREGGLDAATTGPSAEDEQQILDGRFVRGPLVARGGMGEVYKGWDRDRSSAVAVKMLLERFGADTELRARFALEAEMLARVQHPGLVSVHARGELQGRPYFVMDWLEGETLAELIRKHGPLPLSAVVEIGCQVADALGAVHAAGLVHRDIKPGNVMIGADGVCTLLDFGVLRAEEHRLTASGVTLGTPEYMSPEQARNPRLADARSDLYALGATLYAALVGRPPFGGDSAYELIHAHHHERAVPPTQLVRALPSSVDRFIGRALAKDPAERYESGAALSAALRELSPAGPPGLLRALVAGQQPPLPVAGQVTRVSRRAAWLAVTAASVTSLWIYGRTARRPEAVVARSTQASPSADGSPGTSTQAAPPRAPEIALSAPPSPQAEVPKHRSAARPAPLPAAPAPAALRIVTLDRGLSTYASVSVDGAPPRQAPIAEWIVPPGPHRVVVVREGYVSRTVELEVAPGERRKVEIELEVAPP